LTLMRTRSPAELGDDLVEHRRRRTPLDPCPRRASGIKQADLARAGEARSELVGGHDLGQVDQGAGGRGHRDAIDGGDVVRVSGGAQVT
jgi:hypothetical protein